MADAPTALGLLQQITAQRIRVPEDISLIGYDDIEFAAAAAVPLSSVHRPRQVVFEPELVVRRSSQARAHGRS